MFTALFIQRLLCPVYGTHIQTLCGDLHRETGSGLIGDPSGPTGDWATAQQSRTAQPEPGARAETRWNSRASRVL
jgi:hypothetical protein